MKISINTIAKAIVLATLFSQPIIHAMAPKTPAATDTEATISAGSSTAVTSQSASYASSINDDICLLVRLDLTCIGEGELEDGEVSSVKFNSCRVIESLHAVDPSTTKAASTSTPALTMARKKSKSSPILAIAINDTTEKFYYSTLAKKLQTWNLERNTCTTLAPCKEEHKDSITTVIPLQHPLAAASGDMSGIVCAWSSGTDKEAWCKIPAREKQPVWSLASVDENTLAAGYCQLPVTLIDLQSGERKDEIFGTNNALALTMLPDGKLAAGCWDGKIKIIDLKSKRVIQELSGHTNSIGALISLEDGRIISGSYDGTIKIWNTENAKAPCLATLTGHRDAVLSLALLPGDLLASGCKDGTIYIWDLCQNGYPRVKVLREHHGAVTGLALYKGTYLISSSLDASIKTWQLAAS